MMNPVAEHVERLVVAGDNLDVLQHTFQEMIGELGLSHFLYMERPHPVHLLQPGVTPNYLGRETATLACYVESISQIGDPVGIELLRRVAPFAIEEAMRTHLPPARCKKTMVQLEELGLANGLIIPLVSHRGLYYSLAVFTAERDREALATLNRARHEAQILSTYFHQRVREILGRRPPGARNLLTPRERECLLWAACGKTAWETSRILKITERTVKFHLANASRRLDTSNTTHAVARAMLRGEFLP